VVERLGRYQRTLDPGSAVLRPFVDRLKPLIDLRKHVVSFAPQPVITEDNLFSQVFEGMSHALERATASAQPTAQAPPRPADASLQDNQNESRRSVAGRADGAS
jgi:regulator of protease activity HflC (stomatin/prohibitin superfamily)